MDDGVGSLLQNFLKPPLGIVANNQLGIKERIARNADDIEKDQLLPQILENEQFNVTPLEKDMISKVLRLNETKAKDVMTPRAAAFVLDVNEEIGIILDQIIEERYSRIPIYEKDIDNVIGILHIKDLFAQVRKGNLELINIRGLLRESYIVHEYKALDEILLEMQRDRQPFAIVIDEYGGFSGILTLEDILEQIVGDISDEDDEGGFPQALLFFLFVYLMISKFSPGGLFWIFYLLSRSGRAGRSFNGRSSSRGSFFGGSIGRSSGRGFSGGGFSGGGGSFGGGGASGGW